MNLKPKRHRYEKSFRYKHLKTYRQASLVYGDSGLRVFKTFLWTTNHLMKLMLILKKFTKKSDKTLRFFWLKYSLSIPISKKIKGSRMGKGKGKVFMWGTKYRIGSIFLEVKNLRYGRFLQLCHIIKIYLNVGFYSMHQKLKNGCMFSVENVPHVSYKII